MKHRFLPMCSFILCLLILLGCGAREEIVISKLDLVQDQWDSVNVSVSFALHTVFSPNKPILPDSIHIIAYNSSYDTLYSGNDTLFYFPDSNLGNRERVLLEVCGQVKLIRVCEQKTTEASTKRIRLSPEIAYPWRERLYQGSYRLPFIVERQPFGAEDGSWERIRRTKSIEGFIHAYVDGKEEELIRFPFNKQQGGFNLTHHNNYKDFKYYLDSALLDHNEANVLFEIYVNVEGITETVGLISKAVALKSEEEHQVEVARLAKLAADQLMERLHPFLDERKSTVFIDSWDYNTFKKNYVVETEIEWNGKLFTRSTYRLQGVLETSEDGRIATFRFLDGNRRTKRLWDRNQDSRLMVMEPLETFSQNAPPSSSSPSELPTDFTHRVLIVEAEQYDRTRSRNDLSWSLERNRRGYSGTGAMVVLPDRGVRIRERLERQSPSLSYEIDFPEAGTYYLWLRLWAMDSNSNSLYLALDEEDKDPMEVKTDDYRTWSWSNELMSARHPARIQVPSAGTHRLDVWMREDGLYLDQMLLTKNRSFSPHDNSSNAREEDHRPRARSSRSEERLQRD